MTGHGSPLSNHLDAHTRALALIGAAICVGASQKMFQELVNTALLSGAVEEEIVGVLLAVAPAAGEPRIVTAAPKIALALGYDIDLAFELE